MDVFPTEPALEAAVIAHADEDTPRLVYADWLDEHGDPDRAAFIRVQCRLADLPPDDPDWCALEIGHGQIVRRLYERVPHLRPAPPAVLSHDNPHGVLTRHFRRGFPARTTHRKGSEWRTGDLAALVARTTCRDLSFFPIGRRRFVELVSAPEAGHIRGLAFHFPDEDEADEVACAAAHVRLAESPAGRNLHGLNLCIGADHVLRGLAESSGFPALRRLHLVLDNVSSAAVGAFMSAPWLRGLGHLAFGARDPARVVLAAAAELPHLHTLELARWANVDAATLAAGRYPRLTRLACGGKLFGADGLRALLKAPWFVRLHSLDLSDHDLEDDTVATLAAHPIARNLRDLNLHENPMIGRKGLLALSKPGAFPALERLRLSLSRLGERRARKGDVTVFLRRLSCPRLRLLDLDHLPMGDDGARAIAHNPALGELRELHLGEGVSEHGRNALRACEHLRQTTIV